jgi:GNAT superfamily N-acetyltransferase
MRNIQIRPAVAADFSDLLALLKAKAEFDGCLESLAADKEALRAAFFSDTPKAHALVALIDARVVGMATYYGTFSSFLAKPGIWLDDLYVYEDCRHYGVGRALITRLCEIAQQTDCARIQAPGLPRVLHA